MTIFISVEGGGWWDNFTETFLQSFRLRKRMGVPSAEMYVSFLYAMSYDTRSSLSASKKPRTNTLLPPLVSHSSCLHNSQCSSQRLPNLFSSSPCFFSDSSPTRMVYRFVAIKNVLTANILITSRKRRPLRDKLYLSGWHQALLYSRMMMRLQNDHRHYHLSIRRKRDLFHNYKPMCRPTFVYSRNSSVLGSRLWLWMHVRV